MYTMKNSKQTLFKQGGFVWNTGNTNGNPGLNVNQSIKFFCIKMFLCVHVLCSFSLVKLKIEEQI